MERVRIGLIGCGNMARQHARRFTREVPEAEIAALADPDGRARDRLLGEFFPDGGPRQFDDYRAMLAEMALDGVVIVTPHAFHFQQATDAIGAGCHTLIEKPMVISTGDARALIAHAAAHDRRISIAFPGPFTREFQYIRETIARGDLGELYLITGLCAQDQLARMRGTWRMQPELSGGGNLYDSGAHMFNAMLYLTGLAVTDVCAFIDNKGEAVDVVSTIALRFTAGALGNAAVSNAATVFEQGIYIHGTRGSIKSSIYGGSLEHWEGKERVRYPVVPPAMSPQQNFVDLIRGRAETPCPPLLGLRQARLMDAIYESARAGATVSVRADED
jgi:predicted dehydrogenase